MPCSIRVWLQPESNGRSLPWSLGARQENLRAALQFGCCLLVSLPGEKVREPDNRGVLVGIEIERMAVNVDRLRGVAVGFEDHGDSRIEFRVGRTGCGGCSQQRPRAFDLLQLGKG